VTIDENLQEPIFFMANLMKLENVVAHGLIQAYQPIILSFEHEFEDGDTSF